MANRCIGIDIDSSCLHAVQISRTGDEFNIENIFSIQTRRSTDSPQDVLKALTTQYWFDRHADVAISMPNDAVFFRNLESDSAGSEQKRGLSKFTLEHNFPIQPDEIITQECSRRQLPDEKYSVLIAAATRTSLRERLNLFIAARMHPKLVEAAIFAVHSTIAVNHPEVRVGIAIIVYIDESYLTLAVAQDNNILIVRNISIPSGSEGNIDAVDEQLAELLLHETEITWRKVFETEIEQGCKIYMAAAGRICNGLKVIVEKKLNCQITIVDPYAKVKNSLEHKPDAPVSVAEGLALRLLAPEKTAGVNFLEADNSNTKPALNLKKEFVICAILAGAIAAVSLGGLFMRLSHLETKYAKVKNDIREIFQRTLPEEKNIVNPLVQLDQKLQSLRKNYTLFSPVSVAGLGPLEALHAITTSIPPEANININSILITSESVRLIGISPSFESVYNWQRLLEKIHGFSNIDVQNIKREPENQLVHFTMLISLSTVELK
jgi:Tfp pilus assembly PilM family ATPase